MNAALQLLSGDEGPLRFAQVGDGLYRGGQPSRRHLEALKALGVRTVITLRREERRLWQAERRDFEALGMKFFRFPFYGVFGAGEAFLQAVLREMVAGGIYIHCKHGRDRTSLLIALYRVVHEGWDPAEAWQKEVLAYGYQPTWFYRRVRSTFERFVRLRESRRCTDPPCR